MEEESWTLSTLILTDIEIPNIDRNTKIPKYLGAVIYDITPPRLKLTLPW